MLTTKLLDHFWKLVTTISIERFIGFVIMFAIYGYMFYLSRKHRKEIWDGIKGANGKLEPPEIIILFSMILYPVIIMSDVFLGLHPIDGVFWSLDAIILFALTGRVAMNKFGDGEGKKE